MATTGAAWHVSDPDAPAPWAWWDPNSIRTIPFDWTEFLADIESEYEAHEVIADPALNVVGSTENDGVINVTVEAVEPSALVLKAYYPVTVRITCADGQVEDQTLRLRVREK